MIESEKWYDRRLKMKTNKLCLAGVTQKCNLGKGYTHEGWLLLWQLSWVKKTHQRKVGKRFLQVCKLRTLAGPLYGKNTFFCFTYGTGKVEIDLRQNTEKMVCVKDVYPAAQGD